MEEVDLLMIMAMWLVPMATETMLSELISCEPERVKTELLLVANFHSISLSLFTK